MLEQGESLVRVVSRSGPARRTISILYRGFRLGAHSPARCGAKIFAPRRTTLPEEGKGKRRLGVLGVRGGMLGAANHLLRVSSARMGAISTPGIVTNLCVGVLSSLRSGLVGEGRDAKLGGGRGGVAKRVGEKRKVWM